MSGFGETMERLRILILSFASRQISIVVCHLDFDSLVAAFSLRYYIGYILEVNKEVGIFYNGNLNDPFLSAVCQHFSFFSCNLKDMSHFEKSGGHIFIDYVGDSGDVFPEVKGEIVIGNIDRGIVSEHNSGVIKFSSKLASASSIVFNLLSVSGCLRSNKKELKDLVFLLILAIHHDMHITKNRSAHNLTTIGRAIEYLGIMTFHDMLEELPAPIKWEINSDDRK